MKDYELLIMMLVFVMLVMVVYGVVKANFDFERIGSLVVSVCVSVLGMLGIRFFLDGVMGLLVLPYAAMAIAVLAVLLLPVCSRFYRTDEESKFQSEDCFKENDM